MPLNEGFVKERRHEFIRDEVYKPQHKYGMPIEISGDVPKAINSKSWVYILSNPCIPGLSKVGTTTNPPHMRVKELSSSTGVPKKFVVEGTYFSDDPHGDESAICSALNAYRIDGSRGLFKCFLAEAHEACHSYCLCDAKSTLEELADECTVICADQSIKLNLHGWFEEFGVSTIGCTTNTLRAIFELGCERPEDISRDGISIIIEGGGIRNTMFESYQSLLACLEETNEREKLTGIYGPRLPGGFQWLIHEISNQAFSQMMNLSNALHMPTFFLPDYGLLLTKRGDQMIAQKRLK